jgi:archaetidylinositol phosphate synthase
MVSSNLKKQFEALVVKGVEPLGRLGVTPNMITVLGVLVSAASAWYIASYSGNPGSLTLAASLILLSGFLDAIDGTLARATGKVTTFGGFFDSVCDRYSDAIVLAAVIYSGLCDPLWGFAALIGSMMVSYSRSRAEAAGVNMAGVGLAERAERMIFLALAIYAAYYNVQYLNYGVVILALLANFTVIQRSYHFYSKTR